MFVPLYDRNPLKSIAFQYVTVTLIALNVAVYALLEGGWVMSIDEGAARLALIPASLFAGGATVPQFEGEGLVVPERWTLLTYMFLHGGLLHLVGNMAFLWVFGDNVEDAMGHLRFIMFYLMCGVFAGLAHTFVMPESEVPLIGASGAVAGVVAAYLMLHPRVKVWVLALWRIPLRLTAAWVLGFWVALQIFNALFSTGDDVAWWAHVGGMAAGALLILFMRRPGVLLFDKTAGGA